MRITELGQTLALPTGNMLISRGSDEHRSILGFPRGNVTYAMAPEEYATFSPFEGFSEDLAPWSGQLLLASAVAIGLLYWLEARSRGKRHHRAVALAAGSLFAVSVGARIVAAKK